jgi:Icc-related predicted phosphoesterase
MKILLVSDLHYTLKQFDWVNSVAGHFDAVVIAGDCLDISSAVPIHAQVLVILKYLRLLKQQTHVIVCSGNHDLDSLNEYGEKTAGWMQQVRQLEIPCDGDQIDMDGWSFTICPWWDGPKTADRIGEQLATDSAKVDIPWAWVYHAPPDESPTSWAGKRHFGDEKLLEWIREYQPRMVFTGHIHQSPFKPEGCWVDRIGDTWVFNPGRQIGPIPTHIVLDTDKDEARWLSLAGTEVVSLREGLPPS